MTPEIWSIAVGTDGICLCAMRADSSDARRRMFYKPFHDKTYRHLTVIDPCEVAGLLADGLSALLDSGDFATCEEHSALCSSCEFHSDLTETDAQNANGANTDKSFSRRSLKPDPICGLNLNSDDSVAKDSGTASFPDRTPDLNIPDENVRNVKYSGIPKGNSDIGLNQPQNNVATAPDKSEIILPLAIAIVTPHRQTALCMGKDGSPQSPIFLDMPLPISRSDVPGRFRDDDKLCHAYRSSIVRRLNALFPEAGLKPHPGIGTIGSYVDWLLSGHACDACEPFGVPEMYWKHGECRTGGFVDAMGIDWEASYRPVRALSPFARISPYIVERIVQACEPYDGALPYDDSKPSFCPPSAVDPRLSALAGVPICSMGAIDAARAFASNADPIRWSVKLGYDLRAHWNAKRFACAEFEISIRNNRQKDNNNFKSDVSDCKKNDINANNAEDNTTGRNLMPRDEMPVPKSEATQSEDISSVATSLSEARISRTETPSPRTYEDWTRAWRASFALDILPGLRPTDTAYGISHGHMRSIMPSDAIRVAEENGGIYPVRALRGAQVGASGLHIIATLNGNTVVGLRPGHHDAHMMRAIFESMLFDLRSKRAQLPEISSAPVSVILSPPWHPDCAQWVADILATPVRFIPGSEPEIAAIAAASALMRHFDLPVPKTAIHAKIFTPSGRADACRSHYAIHCALCDALS